MKPRLRLNLAFAAAIVVLAVASPSAATIPDRAAPAPYPLLRVTPSGFHTCQGVLTWAPVTATTGVAFAVDQVAKTSWRLMSFRMTNAGKPSAALEFGAGLGWPMSATALWFAGNGGSRGSGDAAAAHGLIFVTFEDRDENYIVSSVSLLVARFDSSGRRTSGWRTLLRQATPNGTEMNISPSPAAAGGTSAAVILGLYYRTRAGGNIIRSKATFFETDPDGVPIGSPVAIPYEIGGQLLVAQPYRPYWNGRRWLVPVGATLFNSPGSWKDISGNRTLVYSISGGRTHEVESSLIAEDTQSLWRAYRGMGLAPWPGSSTDTVLFLEQWKLLPPALQKYELFAAGFTLTRLDAFGAPGKSVKAWIPAITHQLAYDSSYGVAQQADYFSEPVLRDGRLLVSRAYGVSPWKWTPGGVIYRHEQQFLFYSINPATGAVNLKARTFMFFLSRGAAPPSAGVFPGGPMAVINNLSGYSQAWATYFSRW